MENWTLILQKAGYIGALNLDGGPASQLALRDAHGGIEIKGGDKQNYGSTRLVIYSFNLK